MERHQHDVSDYLENLHSLALTSDLLSKHAIIVQSDEYSLSSRIDAADCSGGERKKVFYKRKGLNAQVDPVRVQRRTSLPLLLAGEGEDGTRIAYFIELGRFDLEGV